MFFPSCRGSAAATQNHLRESREGGDGGGWGQKIYKKTQKRGFGDENNGVSQGESWRGSDLRVMGIPGVGRPSREHPCGAAMLAGTRPRPQGDAGAPSPCSLLWGYPNPCSKPPNISHGGGASVPLPRVPSADLLCHVPALSPGSCGAPEEPPSLALIS